LKIADRVIHLVEVHSAGKNGKADGDIWLEDYTGEKNASPFAAFILSGGVRGTNAEL